MCEKGTSEKNNATTFAYRLCANTDVAMQFVQDTGVLNFYCRFSESEEFIALEITQREGKVGFVQNVQTKHCN